jgi:uncharacterized membrane protein
MATIPKARMDALTDGIFAFAMTLLVLDVHLPAGAVYDSPKALLNALSNLGSELLAYVVSFFVLATFWRGVAVRSSEAEPRPAHIHAWLTYLFAMTFIPISTSIVGKYDNLAPAVWIYAANMLAGALASWAMAATWPGTGAPHHSVPTRIRLVVLMATAAASVGVSFLDPEMAMWPYLGNVAAPVLVAWWERHHSQSRARSN